MKRLLVFSFSVVFLMGWLGFSDAAMCDKCRGAGGHEMGHERVMAGERPGGQHSLLAMIASLGLDDKQKEDIKAIHFKCKKDAIKKRADLAVGEIELKEIRGREPMDMSAAEAKIMEIEGIKANLRILHIKSMEEIKSKLTAEQRKKISSLMEMRQMGGMGMGTMGMMGDKHGKCGMMKGGGHMDGDDSEGGDDRPAPETEHQHHH
jgi:Spy/CpxP family protein refolding chaperone